MTVPEEKLTGVIVGSSCCVCTWVSFEEGGDRRSVAAERHDPVCEQESRRRRHLSSQVGVETARRLKRRELK